MANVSQSQIAKALNITQARVCQLSKKGMPTSSINAAKRWRESNDVKRAATNSKSTGADPEAKGNGRPRKPKEASNTGDPIVDALNDATEATKLAYFEYQLACSKGWNTRGQRQSEFNKANQNRILMERLCREEKERRGVLIEKALIIERCRRILNPVVSAIRKLPSEIGPQCNRERPLEAVAILQRAVDLILAATQNATKGLNES